jgi:hypothetical protein
VSTDGETDEAPARAVPGPKIFFIGFNKCGTWALHYFLSKQGVASAHWMIGGMNLAVEITRHADDPAALRRALARWTAFSDLTHVSETLVLEGNSQFKALHAAFPDAYFVLNDRDPDAWVTSRLKHTNRYAERVAAYHRCRVRDLPALWKDMHARHVAAVLEHFAHGGRFLHFHVDCDGIGTLIEFLAPDFALDPRYWKRLNTTAEVQRAERRERIGRLLARLGIRRRRSA